MIKAVFKLAAHDERLFHPWRITSADRRAPAAEPASARNASRKPGLPTYCRGRRAAIHSRNDVFLHRSIPATAVDRYFTLT